LWPNTFYAKQAEYRQLWATPLPLRFGRLLYFSLGGPEAGWRGISGAHLLLLPGLLLAAGRALMPEERRGRPAALLALAWAVAHVFLYAWRLPVTYQHGRYLWPAVPIFILFGLRGWLSLSSLVAGRLAARPRLRFYWRGLTRLTFLALLVVFLLLGAQSFAQDVAFINGEMVAAAEWLARSTPAASLVAAHDIGAIGYFGRRPILDLAGLITPQVIPHMDDQADLAGYITAAGADYLVTAPGWPYEGVLVALPSEQLYSAGYAWTRQQGLNNTAVYALGP
ncbi:MAG: hypothetical protein ACRDHL_13300, partial [Candidatus Promineifilaceae bacterium]